MTFEEANSVVHPVEDEWHYPILTEYGFVPETETAVGFVRSYTYKHPETGRAVRACVGSSRDYWTALDANGNNVDDGLWNTLESFLEKTK